MLYFLLLLMSFDQSSSSTVFDFEAHTDLSKWTVVNDGVMGGISSGRIYISNKGHGVFEGRIRLDYNGGFSSIRLPLDQIDMDGYSKVKIRLKGDGKRYQMRVKSDQSDYHSYITYFKTSGKWEEIEIELGKMYASFRGRRLTIPDYPCKKMEEFGILYGEKKEESFRLEIDYIKLAK